MTSQYLKNLTGIPGSTEKSKMEVLIYYIWCWKKKMEEG